MSSDNPIDNPLRNQNGKFMRGPSDNNQSTSDDTTKPQNKINPTDNEDQKP